MCLHTYNMIARNGLVSRFYGFVWTISPRPFRRCVGNYHGEKVNGRENEFSIFQCAHLWVTRAAYIGLSGVLINQPLISFTCQWRFCRQKLPLAGIAMQCFCKAQQTHYIRGMARHRPTPTDTDAQRCVCVLPTYTPCDPSYRILGRADTRALARSHTQLLTFVSLTPH